MNNIALFFLCLLAVACASNSSSSVTVSSPITKDTVTIIEEKNIVVGANQTDNYLPLLKGKRVGMIVNHTSVLDTVHLIDFLVQQDVQITTIFAPEHGFRGTASAGETIKDGKDSKTGIPIISLYGKNKRPTFEQLKDIDVLVFDIQDVGARFYTYISTMHYAMDAAHEYKKAFIVLDRPNPNGWYIDGNIREEKLKSFVGMHPIPIVHGLTVGELAKMIVGENWLEVKASTTPPLELTVIPCLNYSHNDRYTLPIAPSPNLPSQQSILLYPSICLFEGTKMSVGRGTPSPFEIIGHPDFPASPNTISFVPTPNEGAKNPPLEGKTCIGIDYGKQALATPFSLAPILEAYQKMNKPTDFFNSYFNTLVGSSVLQEQIKNGLSEAEIKATWEEGLANYKTIRKKYLLYPDFD